MNIIKRIFRFFTEKDWHIGFVVNSFESIVNGDPLEIHLMQKEMKGRWTADPFILDVDDENIYVLVEEMLYNRTIGRISKLTVDRASYALRNSEVVLELPTHLSFPMIVRKNGKVFLMPENSASGKWTIYEYNIKDNKLATVFEINEPLTDTVITSLFGDTYLFTTKEPDSNGFNLFVYKWCDSLHVFQNIKKLTFDEHVARMGGDFFEVNGKVYRPAQESNTEYGHAIVIQEVSHDYEKWTFKEIRRLYSPHKDYNLALHTFNSYKGVHVIDVKGYRYPSIAKVLSYVRNHIL